MSFLIKTVILSICMFASLSAQAQLTSHEIPYYGEELYRELKAGIRDRDVVMRLKVILRVTHTVVPGGYDKLGTSCDKGSRCYEHTAIGYGAARVFLLGNYYLVKDGGEYAVRDMYCDNLKTREDFKGGNGGMGPGRVPDNTVINVEHTWPQSRFNGRYPKDMQKSDLHHLFPTDSQINSIRGNYRFGEVQRDAMELKCLASRFGQGQKGMVFEPPRNHRGNVARALFYFSVKYDLSIDPVEEATLKRWNKEDPVDEDEMNRNNAIFEAQKSRNPFVDYPELADLISDF